MISAVSDLSPDEIRRLHEALAASRSAPGARPEQALDARALVAAATTAMQLGRHDDALALARAALVADPKSARAWSLAGTALEKKGLLDDARRALETASSLDDKDLATMMTAAEVQVRCGAVSSGRALATYVILHEKGAPELRARAQALLDATERGE